MKDGAILSNTGHFNVEIELAALRDLAVETREARAFVDEFTLADGRRLYLIGEGRLVNLAAAEGHPALVMDMSFANQALAAEWVIQNAATLERRVYDVPKDIDDEIARLKLETMGIAIDRSRRSRRGTSHRGTKGPKPRSASFASRPTPSSCSTSGACPRRRSSSGASSAAEVADAIRTLAVRGAPAIGVAAAYGLALAAQRGEDLDDAYEVLASSRPTAVNLRWALDELRDDPTPERATGAARGGGRALHADGSTRGRAARRAPRASPGS